MKTKEKVHSLEGAEYWFRENHTGGVVCVRNGIEKKGKVVFQSKEDIYGIVLTAYYILLIYYLIMLEN